MNDTTIKMSAVPVALLSDAPPSMIKKFTSSDGASVDVGKLINSYAQLERKFAEKTNDQPVAPSSAEDYYKDGVTVKMDGKEHTIKGDDPMLKDVSAAAHKHGVSLEAARDIATAGAPHAIKERLEIEAHNAKMAELEKEIPEGDAEKVSGMLEAAVNAGDLTKEQAEEYTNAAKTPAMVQLLKDRFSKDGSGVTKGDAGMPKENEKEAVGKVAEAMVAGNYDKAKEIAAANGIDIKSTGQMPSMDSGKKQYVPTSTPLPTDAPRQSSPAPASPESS